MPRDGTYADMSKEGKRFITENIRRFALFSYDESALLHGSPAGTCVDWDDLGAQLAKKAAKVLRGADPAGMPWEHPRKYSIILSLPSARLIGMEFPKTVIDAARRIYTDYEGNFIGKDD